MFDGLLLPEMQAPFAPPRAPARHLALEQMLVWAYRRQKVDLMSARQLQGAEFAAEGGVFDQRYRPRATSADGCAAVAHIGALGVRVDESPGTGNWDCHPDAEALHEALCAFAEGNRWLDALCLLQAARDGRRPERCAAVPVPYPKPPEEGDDYGNHEEGGRRRRHKIVTAERVAVMVPVTERLTRRGKLRVVGWRAETHEVKYCALAWDPDPTYVAAVNEIAARWERAIAAFRRYLDASGVTFRAHVLKEEP
jgi:hypothetical protein